MRNGRKKEKAGKGNKYKAVSAEDQSTKYHVQMLQEQPVCCEWKGKLAGQKADEERG